MALLQMETTMAVPGDGDHYVGKTMNIALDDIPTIAIMFQALEFDPNATRGLELMTGSFVWSDERPSPDRNGPPISSSKFLQYLISYRSSLICGWPAGEFTPYWEWFREQCPTWPGFTRDRCDQQLYDELIAESDSEYKRLGRALDICWRRGSVD